MSFVRFHKSSMPLFNISIITATGSSIGTDGCKCTTSKEVCMLVSDIFHSFAFSTNEDESKTLCLFLFKVGCFTLTKYFNMPYGGDLRVDTAALMGYAHFSLVYVPLKFRTIWMVYSRMGKLVSTTFYVVVCFYIWQKFILKISKKSVFLFSINYF